MGSSAGLSSHSSHHHAITALVLAVLIGVLFAAGHVSALVLQTALSDGLLALGWIAAMTGLGSIVPRRALFVAEGEPAGALLLATWAGIGLGAIALLVLCLGSMGVMSGGIAWSILVGGWIVLAVKCAMHLRRSGWSVRFQVSPFTWFWLMAAPAVSILLVGPAVLPGVLWGDEPHGYDVVSYHLQIPREWHEAGRVTTLGNNVFSYFPLSMELHYLLAMHLRGGPWAGMYLAQYMHAGVAVVSAAAVYGALRARDRNGATLAAVLSLATPWTAMLGVVAYNEAGLILFCALSLAWILRAISAASLQDARPGYVACMASGTAAGLAYGWKMTAGPMLIAPVAIAIGFISPVIWRRPVMVLVFLVASGVASAPWWTRNLVLTGNPVFPEAMSILPAGHFSTAQVDRWQTAHSPRPDQRQISGRLRALGEQVATDWRFGFVLLPAGVAAGLLRGRTKSAQLLLLVFCAQVVVWLFATHLQGRFLTVAIPAAAMLVGSLAPGRLRAFVFIAAATTSVICSCVLVLRLAAVPAPAFGVRDPAALWDLHPATFEQRLKDRPDPVALAGDARAFWWPVPMSRLSYRTVFDVDVRAGETIIDAWVRGAPQDAVIVVDPAELRRFAATYTGLGPVPAETAARDDPYLREPD